MIPRWLGSLLGREDVFRDGVYNASSNAAATVTRAAVAGKRTTVSRILWSYSADPTGGKITVTDGGTTVHEQDITKGGPGVLSFDALEGAENSAVVVTLAAGGAGVTGKITVEGVLVSSSRSRYA